MSTPTQIIYSYMVIFEQEEAGGYHVSCPVLKGCHSQGDTFEEASNNIREAIELYIESLRADQEPIPQNNLIVQQVCVSV
jgi:predicted RNase H-like HicB family nuclease